MCYGIGMREWTLAGSLLWQARTSAGLTQRQLAERSGVPQSTIAVIESGQREPSIPVLSRILRGAGVELRLTLAPVEVESAVDHDGVMTSVFRRSPLPSL